MQRTRLNRLVSESDTETVHSKKLFRSMSVSDISTDSRSLKTGDVFIAVKGDRFDGHDFIGEAVRRGAACVVYESRMRERIVPLFERSEQPLFIGVADTRKFFGTVAKNYIAHFDIEKIAVTGSCGKTTTRGLVSSVLSQRYRVVSSLKSFNNDIGVPKTMLQTDADTDILVQEIGTNSPGEIEYLSSIVEQDHALITNVGPAHIGFFGTEDGIAREKKSALVWLKASGTAFLNADDPYFEFLREGVRSRVKSFGLLRGDVVPKRPVARWLDHSEFMLQGVAVSVAVAGRHGILNAAAAAAVGLQFGCTLREIKKGIEDYEGEGGRGNIRTGGGTVFVDESYNANPMSVGAALDLISEVETEGRKAFVFADMLELGDRAEHYHALIARRVTDSGIDALFTFGTLSEITASECRAMGLKDVFHYEEIGALSRSLKEWVREKDLVLIKGSRAMRLERVLEYVLC
ncbi:MAG: UDP-N-acetylmuramoyl-tripeptide--D-alanyl-D-alanine ligase [Spirochaetes bacterium]|nr:UDP-N-acetylmuramoyl-tripeptide--D-alanyl-D-alanine ligase [Spirochaetota bacterium]